MEFLIWNTSQEFLKFNTRYHNHTLAEYLSGIHKVNTEIDVVLIPEISGAQGTLSPSVQTWMEIYMKAPATVLPSEYFINVFNYDLWLAIILCVLTIILFLFVLKRQFKYSFNSYVEIVYHTFGISSMSFKIPSFSYSFCQTITALFKFVISSSFSAFLVSELLNMRYELPFETLNEIFNQTEYSFCINEFSYAFEVLSLNYGNATGILNSAKCPEPQETKPNPQYIRNICENPNCVFAYYDFLIVEDLRKNKE